MSATRLKSARLGALVAGVVLCLAGGIGLIVRYRQATGCYHDRPPVRGFIVTIDVRQQQLLIEKFQEFADKHGFESQMAVYTPRGDDFLLDLERKDIEVIASNTSFDLGTFYVYFYNNNCIQPTLASEVDPLVSELRGLLGEIPRAKIVEEQ